MNYITALYFGLVAYGVLNQFELHLKLAAFFWPSGSHTASGDPARFAWLRKALTRICPPCFAFWTSMGYHTAIDPGALAENFGLALLSYTFAVILNRLSR